MRKLLVFTLLAALPLLALAAPMTNDDVIKMVKGGLGDVTVLQAIEAPTPPSTPAPTAW